MIHQLSLEQADAIAAEHGPQIALSVAVHNAGAGRAPFASIVEAVEHDLRESLTDLRIEEGGDVDV